MERRIDLGIDFVGGLYWCWNPSFVKIGIVGSVGERRIRLVDVDCDVGWKVV